MWLACGLCPATTSKRVSLYYRVHSAAACIVLVHMPHTTRTPAKACATKLRHTTSHPPTHPKAQPCSNTSRSHFPHMSLNPTPPHPTPTPQELYHTITMANPLFSQHTRLSEEVFARFMNLPQGEAYQAEYICKSKGRGGGIGRERTRRRGARKLPRKDVGRGGSFSMSLALFLTINTHSLLLHRDRRLRPGLALQDPHPHQGHQQPR